MTILLSLFLFVSNESKAQTCRLPTMNERGLLVLANMARANPNSAVAPKKKKRDPNDPEPTPDAVVIPMLWDQGLGCAAIAHSEDMASNKCYQHNSCNGRDWVKRVEKYYPNWTGLGENIISAGISAASNHMGWMRSEGHRANILGGGFHDFGSGMAMGQNGFGPLPLATEDFGSRTLRALNTYPLIPEAGFVPYYKEKNGELGEATPFLMANYFEYQSSGPQSILAFVKTGNTCRAVHLSHYNGVGAGNSTYAAEFDPGIKCHQVRFKAVSSKGKEEIYPKDFSFGVGACTNEYMAPFDFALCTDLGNPPDNPGPNPPNPTPPQDGEPDPCDTAKYPSRLVAYGPEKDPTNLKVGPITVAQCQSALHGFDSILLTDENQQRMTRQLYGPNDTTLTKVTFNVTKAGKYWVGWRHYTDIFGNVYQDHPTVLLINVQDPSEKPNPTPDPEQPNSCPVSGKDCVNVLDISPKSARNIQKMKLDLFLGKQNGRQVIVIYLFDKNNKLVSRRGVNTDKVSHRGEIYTFNRTKRAGSYTFRVERKSEPGVAVITGSFTVTN